MSWTDTKTWTPEDWAREAAKYCVEHNVVVLANETPLDAANRHAFDEVVKDRTPAGGGYMSFDGDDSCEDCAGWNGRDHRCDCGNRRVDWTAGWGHSFVNPSVYPEAY